MIEDSGIMSQIPQMFLDDSSIAYIEDIDPFFSQPNYQRKDAKKLHDRFKIF